MIILLLASLILFGILVDAAAVGSSPNGLKKVPFYKSISTNNEHSVLLKTLSYFKKTPFRRPRKVPVKTKTANPVKSNLSRTFDILQLPNIAVMMQISSTFASIPTKI